MLGKPNLNGALIENAFTVSKNASYVCSKNTIKENFLQKKIKLLLLSHI